MFCQTKDSKYVTKHIILSFISNYLHYTIYTDTNVTPTEWHAKTTSTPRPQSTLRHRHYTADNIPNKYYHTIPELNTTQVT